MPRTPEISYTLDPYQVLEVARAASVDEIRKSFKKLVLKAHPDKNPDRQEWSEKRIRELFQAFELIGDSKRRREYDRMWRRKGKASRRTVPAEADLFFFRKNDSECQALRVLYFLLHQRGDEAIPLLYALEETKGTDFLREQLDRKDYLDCLFLLGEHLMQRKRYHEALRRFLALYRQERGATFRRHYFDLVVDFLKRLYLRHLPRVLPPDDLVEMVQEGLKSLKWSRKERAQLFLLLAKAFHSLEKPDRVRDYVERALDADPRFNKARQWFREMAS